VTVGGGDRRIFAAGADATSPSSPGLRLGRVDDETLRALYTGAVALAFPSLGEGFGRPPLEAMACGTAAVVAPYLAAAEVLGDAADIVPLDVDRWVAALARLVLEGEDARRRRLEAGIQQAARHSWDAGAETVLRSCETVASGAHGQSSARTGTRAVPWIVTAAPPHIVQPPSPFADLRVAVVHDWLTGMRGGEKVLEALLELVPNADLFTLLHVPGSVSEAIEARRIRTSFIQRLPQAARRYRGYLPLFSRAIESFDLSGYDLVLSSSHCVAKGARPRGAPHLCYCHTPIRYAWDQRDAYLAPGRAHPLVRALAPRMLDRLRAWDVATSARVDRFVANSENVRGRIRRSWGREAGVVYPPVAVERFRPRADREGFYLVVSALVAYKRLEITIDACRQLGRELVIVGSGPDLARLRARAGTGAAVRFTGWLPDEEVADLMERCRALIMPGVEDFGIVPVEAQAAGAPVIALAAGGALETVVASREAASATGVLFDEPTPAALVEAMRTLEGRAFDPAAARANALRFGRGHFLRGMTVEIASLLAGPPLDAVRPGS
jgi:glycosyltransferase involved in cell wall biosynthesis